MSQASTGLSHHEKQAQPAAPSPPLAVSPKEAGRLLALGASSVYGLLRSGALQSYRDGKSRRIPMKSIEAHIERRLAAAAVDNGWRPWKHSPPHRRKRAATMSRRRARIRQQELRVEQE
jgi:excisionase family DNA binding protein